MPVTTCLKCDALIDQGESYCPRHRNLAGGTGQRGSTRAWRITRRRILERDGYQCTATEEGHRCPEVTDLDVHHVIGVAIGGTDADHNLRTLCSDHHAEQSKARSAA